MKNIRFRKGSWALIPALIIAFVSTFVSSPYANATSVSIPDAGFEDNTFTGWSRGSQTGTLGASINGGGTGVTIFNGSRLFSHGANGAMGSPTVNGAPNPYYAPAVAAGSWTFSPKGGTYAVALQPKSEQTFSQATAALGLSGTQTSEITTMLGQQAAAAGFGNGNPTDAAWITREVELTAGAVYTMSWNYMATDYVPYNDGSITSLVPVTVASTPVITVNNFEQSYALLGFTNPGTGDYSTNSYGSTGWQTSTYEVSVTGTYKMGFTSFNLDDTALSPVLMVDDEVGTTQSCTQAGSCTTFGGVAPNNETAPTVAPTTTTEVTTTTTTTTIPPTTTTTIPPASSLEVTSLSDDGSSGTLRWAITQANATAGGIYDSITFSVQGTITLTSDLPVIGQDITITGTGMNTTIISGNSQRRIFYNNGSRNITISDLTLRQGSNQKGGVFYNQSGTITVDRVKFADTENNSGYGAYWQNNGGVTTFTDCIFTGNAAGIGSDYGDTPSVKSDDVAYPNRIYVNSSQFLNNYYGIATERFVRVNNSTFNGNQYAIYLGGLNRQQVYNSSFTNNIYGVYLQSSIPGTWVPGTDNQLIQGNTFSTYSVAIIFANARYGTGSSDGVSPNAWSTSRNNTFDGNGTIYSGLGFVNDGNTVTTTTTTTTTTTSTTIPVSIPEIEVPISVPPVDVINTISPPTTIVEVINLPEVLPEAPEEVFPQPTPDATIDPEPILDEIPSEIINSIPEELVPNTSLPEYLPEELPVETILEEIPVEIIPEDLTPMEITPEESAVIIDQILNVSADEVIAVLSELSVEEITAVIEDISVEQLTEVLNDLPMEEVINLIESIDSADALENIIDAISEETIDPDTAIAVIANGNFEEIPIEQVAAVFAAIEPDQFTEEQKSELAAVLTDAPTEIKESFEEEIDIYGDGFDDYTPTGSNIDVGTRKTVLAAAAAMATSIAVGSGAASGGSSGGSTGGGSGGSGGSSGGTEGRSKREEESEDGFSGEIAGPGEDENEDFAKNSIYKYYTREGKEMKKFNWFGFSKKVWDITAGLGFTLAGSLVVYVTLSGATQRIAGIATLTAILVHYVHEILKNDE